MKAIKDIVLIVMMYVGVIVIVLTLTRCGSGNVKTKSTEYVVDGRYTSIKIVIIDGCEYLWGDWSNATVLTHKGNCTNHRSK